MEITGESREILIETPEAMSRAVEVLLDFAGGRRKFALSGDIGAGKTTFVQAFCRHFGVSGPVTSPTFALINEYPYQESATGHWRTIYHLDLYRLETTEQALDLGIEEVLDNDEYCFIEWPELIEGLLSEECVRIMISIESNSTRKILFL